MSNLRIRIYMSHAWSGFEYTDTVESWIFGQTWTIEKKAIEFRNYHIPSNHEIHGIEDDNLLKRGIAQMIKQTHLVFLPIESPDQYTRWVSREILIARSLGKPILVLNPSAEQNLNTLAKKAATRQVLWDQGALITAIWDMYELSQKIGRKAS
ncbi:MAG: TIR domain-containing protein [Alphaproteobacteria bacterium]|nr:TIR domain-containing protein [Alphaproteobacteria bacterium]